MAKSSRRQRTQERVQEQKRHVEMNDDYSRELIEPKYKPEIRVTPKTENQSVLIDAIYNNEITIAIGPAGVGKTYIVGSLAAKMLGKNDVEKIVLTRANVLVGKTIGLLPGSLEDKMTPLLLPILNVFKDRMGSGLYGYNMAKKKIEMQPLEFVRGMSFKDTFLIIDEAQNLTVDEVKALVTRFESGRIVFLGDPFQSDLPKERCGLVWLEEFAKRHNLNYPAVRFDLEDIVRSDLVKSFLISLYKEEGKVIDKPKSTSSEKCVLLG